MTRIGLVAVLGSALVATGQLPAQAGTGAPAASARVASVVGVAAAPAGMASPVAVESSAAAVAAAKAAVAGRQSSGAVAAPAAVLTAAKVSAARRAKVIRTAKKYVGVRYVWGGSKPRPGFDCSGYTKYVFARAGKALPRTSRAQHAKVRKIKRSAARAGDLVFFKSSSGRVYHVGIYAGKGRMYDSPRPGRRVGLHKIWSKRVSFGRAV